MLNNLVPEAIGPDIFRVGGEGLSGPEDCLCYLVKGSGAAVLIDAGAGPSAWFVLNLARQAAGGEITDLLLTHAHIDHAGGAAQIAQASGCRVWIHRADAPALARGDERYSAAAWYGLPLDPLQADVELSGGESLDLGSGEKLEIIHTPGHTPGSVAALLDRNGRKYLFGQDIHGPFSRDFSSDVDLWAQSMARLLDIKADVLAEGHYGIFEPAEEVEAFIKEQLAAHGRGS